MRVRFLFVLVLTYVSFDRSHAQQSDEVNFQVGSNASIKDPNIYDSIFYSLEDALKAPLRVSELSLEGKELKKFPAVVLTFKNISTLNISYNRIDSIPVNLFDKCRKLRVIHYAGNELNEIPPTLFHPLLKVLNVSENNLTRIPDGVRRCKQLEELDLHANQLTNYPSSSFVLMSLQSLILSGNPLTTLSPWIMNQPRLKILFIDNTKIETLPEELCKVSTLRFLNIEENKIKELPACFCEMKKLKIVMVAGSALSEAKLGELSRCLPALQIR